MDATSKPKRNLGPWVLAALTCQRGFSLLEISIVLLIAGLLGNIFIAPMGQYIESEKRQLTMLQLETARSAVMGFVAAHGRFPCPASLLGPPIEISDCSESDLVGAVPAATLGLGGARNEAGLPIDAWGRPLRYAVSQIDHSELGSPGQADLLVSGEMAEVGMQHLQPNLTICAETSSDNCRDKMLRANQVPALFFSLGRDPSGTAHQAENQDDDTVFVQREYSRKVGEEFDDQILWISENILFFRLLQAGVLP